jgi:dipeptidyl aminopeptidase/acylaminoacyl peptidase
VILSSDANPVEEAEIAGRPVLVVEWGGSRLWADAETGLALNRQTLEGVTPELEIHVDQVVYGVKAPEVVFSPDGLEGARFEPAPSIQAEQPNPTPLPEVEAGPRITVIAGVEAVNVRSGPSTEAFPVIGTLTAGESALALGRSPDGEWIKISYPPAPDESAWINAFYIELSGGDLPVVDLPVVEAPPTATPLPVQNREGDPIQLTIGGGVVPGQRGSGGLFFVLQTRNEGFTYQFLGVELDCLLSELSCKAVPLPEFQQENYTTFGDGLTWAPDGKKAVFIDSNNQQLHLYRAGIGEWQTIAYQLFISGGALSWSPDGTYLAGITQSEDGLSNLVTVIPADGEQEEPSWRVYAEDLGGDQTVVGWADDQTVLFVRAWTPPKGAAGEAEPPRLYRLNVISGEWDELVELGWNKGFPALSPDGSTLILNMERDGQVGLWSVGVDNGEASYLGVNGDYVTWSPDGQWIAFSSYQDGQYTAYRIRADGSGGLTQLFEWNSAFSIHWSPEGEHLLLQAWPTDTESTVFFWVSLSDGAAQRILLEGAGVTSEPRYPSFQPTGGR